jgi:hypothetical protein
MPSPALEIDVKNGYFDIINEEDKQKLIKGIISLQTSVMYNEKDNSINIAKGTFANINPSLKAIESAKINDMVRVAKKQLNKNPMCKVGVFCNFLDSIDRLQVSLKEYNPIVLRGSVNKNKRQELIDKFQADNNDCRVVIGLISVVATGIDLDDKFGNRPRFAYAIPNYSILNLHQLTRRFIRLDSKSVPKFRFFYGKVSRKEISILNSLARKSNVLSDTLEDQVLTENLKFPGELPVEEE